MLSFLPATVRGCIVVSLYFINTFVGFLLIMLISLLKFIIPIEPFTNLCNIVLKKIASAWVGANCFFMRLVNKVEWDVQGLDDLDMDGWYLVMSNHQSWTDILVLQTVFFRKIPFLKFFLKKELIWVPLLGLAWWALDFPFMQRHSKEFLEKNPHLRGKDLETTKKACEKFVKHPVSVMNFVEGTRLTPEKHMRQQSPYANLLRPKAGGVAFVLGAMGTTLKKIVNVTIAYPSGKKSFWDFVCGRIDRICVRVDTLPITADMQGDYFGDPAYAASFQEFLNRLWEEKDKLLQELCGNSPAVQKAKGKAAA
ncbi:MAG: acyltransferase [Desulfatibacillaceae bacterium]|nr:acyltransferase [Desulfatibacillaceae bacterium]